MPPLFLQTVVSIGITFNIIKSSLQPLIADCILQHLCITDSDLALWDDDTGEFVSRAYSSLEYFNILRAAESSLLFVMVKIRRSTVLKQFITFIVQVLDDNASRQGPEGLPFPTYYMSSQIHAMPTILDASRAMLAKRTDGALFATGTVREMFSVHVRGVSHLNLLMEQHVLHELDSHIPFHCGSSSWLFSQLAASDTLYVSMFHCALGAIQRCLS